MDHALDGHATLTTEHPASSYGVPVLIDDRHPDPIGAGDPMHAGTEMTGSDYVSSYHKLGDEIPDIVRQYLASAPLKTVHVLGLLAPPIYGYAEIAEQLGVNTNLLAQWKSRGKLPEPDAQLAMGPVWLAATIEAWIAERRQDQGDS